MHQLVRSSCLALDYAMEYLKFFKCSIESYKARLSNTGTSLCFECTEAKMLCMLFLSIPVNESLSYALFCFTTGLHGKIK